MTCQQQLRAEGKPYPRTCADCGLGPCYQPGTLPPPADFAAIRDRLQNSVNWMLEGRSTGLCVGVADFQALIRLLDAHGVKGNAHQESGAPKP